MVIIPTSITAGAWNIFSFTGLIDFHIYGLFFHSGSTGIALGAKVNMFCVLQRTKAMERKISSTMLRE